MLRRARACPLDRRVADLSSASVSGRVSDSASVYTGGDGLASIGGSAVLEVGGVGSAAFADGLSVAGGSVVMEVAIGSLVARHRWM